jgi:hypothetical protein
MAQLVVAHYNESLDWLSYIPFPGMNILIYEKGDYSHTLAGDGRIALPNIGREAHTYLTHIVNNYYNLSEFTIFCQGNWTDHVHNLWQSLSISFDKGFSDFAHLRIHMCFNEASYNDMLKRNPWSKFIKMANPSLVALFHEVFPDEPLPDWIEFGANAIFNVRKDVVHRHSLDVYKKLLSHFDHEKHTKEHIEEMPYTLEYFWKILFVYNNL